MKPHDTKVHIYYAGEYVCTTHTNRNKPTAKACLAYFIECGRQIDNYDFYHNIKNTKADFDESKFKASYK